MHPAPLILTLRLDAPSFERLDALRRRFFPPERNFIPAHITLFHALPGEHEAEVGETLTLVTQRTAPFAVRFPGVRFLGRGVALEVEAPELRTLRGWLVHQWEPWLGAQDRQSYRPHVTVQNKVASAVARELHDHLSATWEPFAARAEGLTLWYYRGGPWELAGEYSFAQ